MNEKQTAKFFYDKFNFLILKCLKKGAAIKSVQLILEMSNKEKYEWYVNDNCIRTDRFFYKEVITEIQNL